MVKALEWTEYEDDYLRFNYLSSNYSEMRMELFKLNKTHNFYPARTPYSIKQRIAEIGLIKPSKQGGINGRGV